jgi:hypothetical protein
MSSSACNTMKLQKVETPGIHPSTSRIHSRRSAIWAQPQSVRHWATYQCNVVVSLVPMVSFHCFHCSRVTWASSNQKIHPPISHLLNSFYKDCNRTPSPFIAFILFWQDLQSSLKNTEKQRHTWYAQHEFQCPLYLDYLDILCLAWL